MRTLNGWPVSPSRTVRAPDGGTISFRERSGPTAEAPTVLLLHGLGATSGLQFMPTLDQLAGDFRVIALDMRVGRRRGRDLLASVAGDAVTLMDALGIERAVVLGYSVGGLVARYLAASVPERVAGVVLAATADPPRVPGARRAAGLAAEGASLVPVRWPRGSEASPLRFAVGELGRLSPVLVLRAVEHALAERAPSPADLLQPVVFLVTTRDRLVPAARQRQLAATCPDALVIEVAAGHAASGLEPEVFGPAALQACRAAAGLRAA